MTTPAHKSELPNEEAEGVRGRSLRVWPAAPQRGVGRSHGTSSSEPFDRWFRYPAGFASDYASYLLSRLGLSAGKTVVDCFAGSGVIGTAAREAGLAFAGIEAHPMVAELAGLKVRGGASGTDLRSAAHDIVRRVAARSYSATSEFTADTESTQQSTLLGRSFSDQVMAQLFLLRDAVRNEPESGQQLYLKWALLACLRDVAQVKVGWPYQRPGVSRKPRHTDVLSRFEQRVAFMADDVDSVVDDNLARRVVVGDSRVAKAWLSALGGAVADGCVSSPPYLNNFDYADATRLEAYFWGEATSWAQLCSHIRAGMLTATTQQSSIAEARRSLETLRSSAIAKEVFQLSEKLTAQRNERVRGKEYDQVLPAYFSAISQVLRNLSQRMAPNAPVAWLIGDSAPYGVHVDTPRMIGELATDYRFTVEADVVLRERGRRWATARNRHAVPLSERLLVLKGP